METFASQIMDVLKRESRLADRLSSFMGNPIITLDPNAVSEVSQLKQEIGDLIDRHFPERKENIMIVIKREGQEDIGFKIWKST